MLIRKFTLLAVLAGTLALTGCDDDSSSNGGGAGGNGTFTGTVTTLDEPVPVAAVLAGAEVTATGANGETATGTTNGQGQYRINVQGLTTPILFTVEEEGEVSYVAVSFSFGGINNINALTTLAASIAYDTEDFDGMLTNWEEGFSNDINNYEMFEALKIVNANLAALYTEADLDAETFNFQTAQVNAAFAGLLADLDCTITAGDPITYNCNDTPFNLGISIVGFFPYGNLGFAVEAGQTWELVIKTTIAGQTVTAPAVEVGYTSVPIFTGTFGEITADTVGSDIPDVEFEITSFNLTSTGTGAVGSKVIGTMNGRIETVGFEGPFAYTYTYTLTAVAAE